MRITALIAASAAALALASTAASAASPAPHDLALAIDGNNYVVTSVNDDLGLDNDRGHLDRHVIGANDLVSGHLASTDTAAGNHGHVLLN